MRKKATVGPAHGSGSRRVLLSGAFLTLAIVIPAWAAIEILPRTGLGVEHLSVGLGLAFFIWWAYGQDTAGLRSMLHHRLHTHSWLAWLLVIGSMTIATFFFWLRLYLSPERLLRDRLLAVATSEGLIQGERKEERSLSWNGFLPGWQLRYYKAGDLRSPGLILLNDDKGQDHVDLVRGKPLPRPLLVLAQPAIRKRPFLLALRRTLAGAPSPVPSALIGIRECYARGDRNIETCLRSELSNLFKGPDVRFRPSVDELSDAFDSNKEWWLLVDGIDDSSSGSEMVRLIREALTQAKRHGGRIVLSSRRSLLEYVVEKTISDDLDEFLKNAWIISVNGLDEAGFERRRMELVGQRGERGSRARQAFDRLEAEAKLDAESRELVADIKRMTLVIDGIAQLDLDGSSETTEEARSAIARWAATRQFEAHCFGELCGNDERKAVIERIWRLMTGCLGEYSEREGASVIGLDVLDEAVSKLNPNPGVSRDAVLYALLGTGMLDPVKRDTFRINRVWATPQRQSSPADCRIGGEKRAGRSSLRPRQTSTTTDPQPRRKETLRQAAVAGGS